MPLDERYRYHRLDAEGKQGLIEVVRRILEERGVTLAIIFGSFVELDSFRDIDVAVYIGPMEADLDAIFKLTAEIEEEIHIPVDVVPLESIQTKFKHYILTKGRVILEREPGLHEALIIQTIDEQILLEGKEGQRDE
ncbi:nucleotidyltransferase domain-containing protein [Candidatus Bathyarchaeota archaeon]|nr:nucleotidyltransferase domain-containing protein [Candidatus Bathyarchaeota archaeon]